MNALLKFCLRVSENSDTPTETSTISSARRKRSQPPVFESINRPGVFIEQKSDRFEITFNSKEEAENANKALRVELFNKNVPRISPDDLKKTSDNFNTIQLKNLDFTVEENRLIIKEKKPQD